MFPCTFACPSTTNRLHSPSPALTLPSSPPALYHQDSTTRNWSLLTSFVQLIHSIGVQWLWAPAFRVCHVSEHAVPFPTAHACCFLHFSPGKLQFHQLKRHVHRPVTPPPSQAGMRAGAHTAHLHYAAPLLHCLSPHPVTSFPVC